MKDNWCKPLQMPDGKTVSGGAARNVRLAAAGGVEQVLRDFLNVLDERISGDPSQFQKKTRHIRPSIPSKSRTNRPTMH